MIYQDIEALVQSVDERLKDLSVTIEQPKNPEYGDLATPIAFSLAKTWRQSPKQIAEQLATSIRPDSRIAAITPINGFMNFKLSDQCLLDLGFYPNRELAQLRTLTPPQKVLLEFVSANPTGPLHIGHGRWAVIGDVLARLLKTIGHQVETEFYVNDAGLQIILFRQSVEAAHNGQPIPENGYHGAYVNDIAGQGGDPVEIMLTQQRETMQSMQVAFDHWFNELTLHRSGMVESTINKLRALGHLYEAEGALWFRSTTFGDDKDRVLIKADGQKTYFAADIAYHADKVQRGYNRLINIWGADHHGYVARVKAAVNALTPAGDTAVQFDVIIGQLVSLFRNGEPVKMSKRTGEMITLQEVIDEIGVDATRYFLARRGTNTQIEFDLEVAKKETDENPVYYVQYAHARICSILRKAGQNLQTTDPVEIIDYTDYKLHPDERALLIKLVFFPVVIANAARNSDLYLLCNYAEELAAIFHSFYHNCRVIGDDPRLQEVRLQIVQSTRLVLAKTLELLGVSTPEEM